MSGIFCPECGHSLKLGSHPHQGQRVVCPRCKSSLVVVGVEPLDLDLVMPVNHSTKSKKQSSVVEAACPECDHFIKLSTRFREGEQVVCDACQAKLEVVSTDPFELDVALARNLKHSRR